MFTVMSNGHKPHEELTDPYEIDKAIEEVLTAYVHNSLLTIVVRHSISIIAGTSTEISAFALVAACKRKILHASFSMLHWRAMVFENVPWK